MLQSESRGLLDVCHILNLNHPSGHLSQRFAVDPRTLPPPSLGAVSAAFPGTSWRPETHALSR